MTDVENHKSMFDIWGVVNGEAITHAERKARIKRIGQELETPADFWSVINAEFEFDVDVCANDKNAKCKRYLSAAQNALDNKIHWVVRVCEAMRGRCWCNPGFGTVLPWHQKAYAEAQKHPAAAVVVAGIQGASQKWFDFAYHNASEIRLCKDRIDYIVPQEGIDLGMKQGTNNRESCLYIYRRKLIEAPAQIVLYDWRALLKEAA